MAENNKESNGVQNSQQQSRGIMGMSEKLGLGKATVKKQPKKKPEQLGYGNVPDLAHMKLAEMQQGGMSGMGSPVDQIQNKVARSSPGKNKRQIFSNRMNNGMMYGK